MVNQVALHTKKALNVAISCCKREQTTRGLPWCVYEVLRTKKNPPHKDNAVQIEAAKFLNVMKKPYQKKWQGTPHHTKAKSLYRTPKDISLWNRNCDLGWFLADWQFWKKNWRPIISNFCGQFFMFSGAKGSWVARMGRNFDDYPGFQPMRSWANTYQCTGL